MRHTLIIILLSTNFLLSQNKKGEIRIPYRDGKLWGLCDTLGVVKLRPFADSISFYNISKNFEGRYVVYEKNIQKVIDENGNTLLTNKDYDSISIEDIDYGIQVYKNSKAGIFLAGKEIIPCKYDIIYSAPNKSFKVVRNDKYGLINSLGQEIIPVEYLYINSSKKMSKSSEKFIWTAQKKSGITKEFYDIYLDSTYSNEKILLNEAKMIALNNINKKRDENLRKNYFELTRKYDYVQDLVDERFAIVQNDNPSAQTIEDSHQAGLVNLKMMEIIFPVIFQGIYPVAKENGKIIFETYKNGKYNLFDEDKKQLQPIDYERSVKYTDNMYMIEKNGKWGVRMFNTIYPYIEMKYEDIDFYTKIPITASWSFNIFKVGKDGKKGYIGENGIEYFKN